MVTTALRIAAEHRPDASVWSVPVIKPLDVGAVLAIAAGSRCIVSLEEHSVLGGLGSAIAEICAEHRPSPILRIGIEDRFSEHCGSYEYLLSEHRIDAASVRDRIDAFPPAR
jgi:transketolase